MIELGPLAGALFPQADQPRLHGVVVGIVTNNRDPEGLGRVKVKCPSLSAEHESFWARLVTPMAGKERGLYLLPEVDDEVLIAFEHGSPGFAYALGALWNGPDKPPENNSNGSNDHRTFKSRSGHVLRFDDASGAERIEIISAGEKSRVVIDAVANTITIEADSDITIKSKNGTVTLSGRALELSSATSVKVTANSTMDLKASGPMTLKGATIDIN